MSEPTTDEHGRREPSTAADEADTLLGFLTFLRDTLRWRTNGLTDDELSVTLAPSSMTLGGMLKHLSYVEDYWFTEVVAEAPMPAPWGDVDWAADPGWDWNSALGDAGDDLRTLWQHSVDRSDQVAAQARDDLGATHPAWGGRGQVSTRWVLTHMIEEYARHCGHADLIRESIDGQTGE